MHPSFSESIQLFKSLAREAAKGLGSKLGTESWIDWLDLLRCAKDQSTGGTLYAQIRSHTFVVSERGRDGMLCEGENFPAGALIEFAIGEDGLQRRLYCETASATIETLFRNSANLCLELRSLTRQIHLQARDECFLNLRPILREQGSKQQARPTDGLHTAMKVADIVARIAGQTVGG